MREGLIRDSHFGAMPGRGMTDAIFAVRQRMEKQWKTDLEKACDRVPQQEIWRRNREKGLPDNYVGLMLVQDMYEGARTREKPDVLGQ